jgi:uncharacterized RDD family membrane protein YckC
MTRSHHLLPVLTILCLFGGPAHGQDLAKELTEAREAASLMLNATGEVRAPGRSRRNAGEVVRVFSDLVEDEPLDYDNVAILFGDGKITGDVKKDILVVWGNIEVDGRVGRNTTAIFGSITLGPNAELSGDTRVFGGRLIKDPSAVVKRQPVEMGGNYERWPVMSAAVDWFQNGAVIGRPIAPAVHLSWLVAALFFLAYGLAAMLFPRPVSACASAMQTRPASSFLMGILLPMLVLLLAALLTMTGVGVLVVPFLLIALAFATVVGKAAVMQFIGQRFGGALRRKRLESPGAAFLTGGVILCLLYTIPILGIFVWGVTMLFAMGAAMLATVESLQDEGSQLVSEPVPGVGLSKSTAMVHVGPAANADLKPAGFWLRFCSLLLDWFIVGTVAALVSAGILFVPMIFTYYIGMWGWRGSTVGDMVMNLRLVRDQGRPMDYAAGVVRALASLFSIGALGLGFAWCAISREKKSWHDHIAGTNVMRVPDPGKTRK